MKKRLCNLLKRGERKGGQEKKFYCSHTVYSPPSCVLPIESSQYIVSNATMKSGV